MTSKEVYSIIVVAKKKEVYIMKITADEQKDVFLQIRIAYSLKKEFQAICKKKAINSSELLRQFITQWVYEQSQPINPQRRVTDISNINQ